MLLRFILALIIFSGAISTSFANENIISFTQRIDQAFGGGQCPDEARAAGIAKAKADALEQAGTYVESMSVVEDFVLKKDETMALAAGVLKTDVLGQRNYGTENGFGMILDIEIAVDKAILADRLVQIKTDQVLLRKYQELQNREAELLARIKKLESLATLSDNQNTISKETSDDYRTAVQGLPAVELNRKALELWSNGRFSEPRQALDFLDQALALDPINTTTINNRGVALFQLGQKQKALDEFNKALKMAPGYADGYNNRAIVYMAQKKYKMAEQDFTRVLELMPLRVEAYINRAVTRKHQWLHHLALEDYKRAMVIDPDHSKQQDQQDSASLEFNELERICIKAYRACSLGLCKSLTYLKSKDFCQ